jgi:hypothetical protein
MWADFCYNTRMMIQGTPVKTASKDILARLLASEDLIVEHSAEAETAYFDTQSRRLVLPVWQDMDNFMYDMLCGHEVGHALYTPADGWQEFVGEGKGAGLRHMTLNICEDARIERMMKKKFPGLKRDFVKAYKSLHERDLFELKDKVVADLPLLDRINLYYKGEIYGQITVPFTAEERTWLDRLDAAESFKDVMAIAEDLAEKTEQDRPEPEQQEDGQEGAGAGDGEGAGGSGSESADSDEGGEGAAGAGAGDEDGDEDSSGSGDGDDQGEDSGQSTADDTDDGESADSTAGEGGQDGNGPSDLSYESYSNETGPGCTQSSYEKAVSGMRDGEAVRQIYHTVPEINLDNIVVGPEMIAEVWNRYDAKYEDKRRIQESVAQLQKFQARTKATVAQMVQHFQMKQAADASKRTSVAKTGVLDPVGMINYRWSEDIFLKNEVHSDGKSHGIVMFLDWSGSMSNILQDTIEQLLVLVEFCRKAGIPYDVYAFSSHRWIGDTGSDMDRYSRELRDAEDKYVLDNPQWQMSRDSDFKPHDFTLYNFLSSRLNGRAHKVAVTNLYRLAQGCYGGPNCFHLGGTPLNEAVIAALDLIPEFQRANDVQIANVVFLTDGDSHSSLGRDWGSQENNVRDAKTKKTYKIGNRETDAYVNMLRDRTGATLISMRLHDSSNLKSLRYRYFTDGDWDTQNKKFEAASKAYKNDHFVLIENTPYDEEFIVMGDLKVETDALTALPEDASNTRIRNAFIKGGNRKKSSRVIATRLVDLIAVD